MPNPVPSPRASASLRPPPLPLPLPALTHPRAAAHGGAPAVRVAPAVATVAELCGAHLAQSCSNGGQRLINLRSRRGRPGSALGGRRSRRRPCPRPAAAARPAASRTRAPARAAGEREGGGGGDGGGDVEVGLVEASGRRPRRPPIGHVVEDGPPKVVVANLTACQSQ